MNPKPIKLKLALEPNEQAKHAAVVESFRRRGMTGPLVDHAIYHIGLDSAFLEIQTPK